MVENLQEREMVEQLSHRPLLHNNKCTRLCLFFGLLYLHVWIIHMHILLYSCTDMHCLWIQLGWSVWWLQGLDLDGTKLPVLVSAELSDVIQTGVWFSFSRHASVEGSILFPVRLWVWVVGTHFGLTMPLQQIFLRTAATIFLQNPQPTPSTMF